MQNTPNNPRMNAMSTILFGSRWLQVPLYLGLIVAQGVYVFHFMVELMHLVQGIASLNEEHIMLIVLGLIDVVMISNLLIMVIVGGYETFVSRLNLKGHPDEPDWLSHVNANLLKVKLATAIIGRMVGVKYAMRTSVRPAMRSLTQSAIRMARAIDSGIVPSANQVLLTSEVQNTGSSTMVR